MSSALHHIYTIRQIGNGYLVAINEETLVETCDTDYLEALSRLLTHLTSKINEIHDMEEE